MKTEYTENKQLNWYIFSDIVKYFCEQKKEWLWYKSRIEEEYNRERMLNGNWRLNRENKIIQEFKLRKLSDNGNQILCFIRYGNIQSRLFLLNSLKFLDFYIRSGQNEIKMKKMDQSLKNI